MGGSFLDIGVIGAGSWGTALAILLAKNGHRVTLWVYEDEVYDQIGAFHENRIYLPGFQLPGRIAPSRSLAEASSKKDLIVSALPSHVVRHVIHQCVPFLETRTIIVSVSKGIENETLKTMTEVLRDNLPSDMHSQIVCLSGPSFAKEVVQYMPTAVVAAATIQKTAEKVQQVFAAHYFRVYTSTDVMGVELGGALKNVIAIAAGCSDGLGFGNNTRAALITRGLAEITRLAVEAGAHPLTLSGLSGLGDLVLTCTGALSRNRSVGIKLGKGSDLDEIITSSKMVAEGIKTTTSAFQLAQRLGVEMPIVEQVYAVLYHKKDPRQAVTDLMGRSLRYELDGHL
ncbi:MAG: NAD(P)H-dependent glycerol-3-phosphate dehydrogenase [Deltaproteobacteria bacterium]|nr:NAD(P)H-dependent glycerol-3-phosphate dehydrogenase [Deltaproteobacteria bacterium]